MTRDEIITLAADACRSNVDGWLHHMAKKQPRVLERFAALVAAAERREISELLGEYPIPVRTLIEIRDAMNLKGM